MEKKEIYLWLNSINGINKKTMEILKEEIGEIEGLMQLTDKEIFKLKSLNLNLLENIVKYKSHLYIDKLKEDLYKYKIEYVCIEDDNYPKKLKEIYDAPLVLFYVGDISFLNEDSKDIAVVGARKATTYGIRTTKKLVKGLSSLGINIISGLAMGIDSQAHLSSLEGIGKTAAVLGSSVENVLPKCNIKVAEKILENGGVILSEFYIGSKVFRHNYSKRNRVISGLSNGVLVIEAGKKSGALITSDCALDQGREVFAVPGNIDSQMSEGCNKLIREGAKIVRDIDDIIEEYNFKSLKNSKDSIEYDIKGLNFHQMEIVDLIKSKGSLHIDDICDCTHNQIKTVNSSINELMMRDIIIEMKNKTYGLNI